MRAVQFIAGGKRPLWTQQAVKRSRASTFKTSCLLDTVDGQNPALPIIRNIP